MEWKCNAAQEIKEKGEGDIESMQKFITSWEDSKKLLAAERVMKNSLLQLSHFTLSALLCPIMSKELWLFSDRLLLQLDAERILG